jgi:hypothetical protein
VSSGRGRLSHGTVYELENGVTERVHEYSTWEDALTAAGLDPAIAAETRRADQRALR